MGGIEIGDDVGDGPARYLTADQVRTVADALAEITPQDFGDRYDASALESLLIDPWQPFVFAGFHRCEFRRLTGGPSTFATITGTAIVLGYNNLYIPADGFLYVAPSTIIHYIDVHECAPPDEIQDAGLNCPEMRSLSYLKLIRKNAPAEFLKRFCSADIPIGDVLADTTVAEQTDERGPD